MDYFVSEKRPEEEKLIQAANAIAEWNIESLIHPPNAQSFGFDEHRRFIASIQRFYSEVAVSNFDFPPDHVLTVLSEKALSVSSLFTRFQSFDQQQGDPNTTRRQLIGNLQSQWQDAYSNQAAVI